MTIRQQGGVFGRNPKFNDVEASSVTISSENNPVLLAERTANTADIDLVDPQSTARIRNVAGRVQFYADANNERADSGFRFYVDNLRKVDIDTNGNIVFANSGSGIDFSATSGTGTSELFDDYEEGTFTVSAVRITNLTTNVGRYTKVGNLVTCEINLSWTDTDNAGSTILFTGLPFTSATGVEVTVGPVIAYGTEINTNVGVPIALSVDDNQTRFYFYRAMAASATLLQSSEVDGATTIRSTFTYTAA